MIDFFYYTSMSLFVFVAVILILIVLIQKGRGGGLASAFGGVGGHSAFGSKTGDVLTWATAIIFGVFLLLAVATNISFRKKQLATGGPAPITKPTNVPLSANPNMPAAPMTADPGVANPPPGAPTGPTTAPAAELAPATQPGSR